MGRYKKKRVSQDSEGNIELDLAPMLSLMVCLIPIMLLSSVFLRVTVIESSLPQVVQEALERDRNNKDREVNVSVYMDAENGLRLEVKSSTGSLVSRQSFSQKEGEWDLDGLYGELTKIKRAHPEVFRLNLYPGENVSYDHIVKLMDEVRTLRHGEDKISIRDRLTQEVVETNLMYPDVFFANVMGG